jgi:hypothetical protein
MSSEKREMHRKYVHAWRTTRQALSRSPSHLETNPAVEVQSLDLPLEEQSEGADGVVMSVDMEQNCGEYSSDTEHHLHSENAREQPIATWEVINSLNESLAFYLEDDDSEDMSLAEELSTWAIEYQIKHNALDNLLKLLKKHGHSELPSTARTLLHTPRQLDTQQSSGMEYVYFPLKQKLQETLESYPLDEVVQLDCVDLSLNVDGLPLYKSSKTCMWPVLCAVMLDPVTIFPTALTCGASRPTDLGFLEDTVRDLGHLMNDGITFMGRKIKVNLRCFVCDAPARALVKNIKLYSGYFGCDRCEQKGVWLNRVTYQETADLILRTDEAFRNQTQFQHHHGNTPVSHLPIDMVRCFPIDYMHQACLGVMKRLLLIWTRGDRAVRVSASQTKEISARLLSLRNCIPSAFVRMPRGLEELDRWKATEFRQFLLYTGKIVLKGILPDDVYLHFLSFSVAMAILVCPSLVQEHSKYANELLQYFVEKGRTLYGQEFLVYNTHTMLHIASDAEHFGCLENCSAFMFENYLQSLKKMVRSGRHPLIQVSKRLEEMSKQKKTPNNTNVQKISTKARDCAYILSGGQCCEVLQVPDKEERVLCRVYSKPYPLFHSPCTSFLIGAYTYNQKNNMVKWIPTSELTKHAIKMNAEDRSVIFLSLLHKL